MLPNASRGRTKIRPPRKILSAGMDVDKSWAVLRKAIEEIQHKNASKLSFEELYRKAYNLVLRKHGKLLYDRVEDEICKYLSNEVRLRLLEKLNSPGTDDHQFLQALNLEWEDHLLSMRMISDVLMYLDRVYAKESHLPLIYDVGLNAFRDSVIKYNDNEIGGKVIGIIINYLNTSRYGEMVDKFIIKAIIYMFESLTETLNIDVSSATGSTSYGENYYLHYFEPKLMLSSHEYFEDKAQELLEQRSGAVYIEKVTQLIQEEESRIQLYLPDVSAPKLIELMDTDFISRNLESIMMLETDGAKSWIADDNFSLLQQLFTLINRVDSEHEMLKRRLRAIIMINGEEMNKQTEEELDQEVSQRKQEEEKKREVAESHGKKLIARHRSSKEQATRYAIKWIQNFLTLKRKYDAVIERSFDNNLGVIEEVDAAFSTFLNGNSKSAEYLSLYIDDSIRKSLKDKSAEEIDHTLDNCIVVFRFIKDKDIFEKYYKNHLAKRLLQQKSLSSEIEMNMIAKLKQEIGSSFTTRLEGMFKDIKLSQELSAEFNERFARQGAGETEVGAEIRKVNHDRRLELDASILTTSFWPMPINKVMEGVQYPAELQILREKYKDFYEGKHRGRNLTWAPNFGTVDIRMHFTKKIYEVNMATLAAIIILKCFNGNEGEKNKYTFEEIQEVTQIPTPDLNRHLQSISVASRSRLLKKTPMSRDIRPGDVFEINEHFKSPQARIKVLTVASGSKAEDDTQRNETMEIITKSRIVETEAAIVRIMKARRILKHQELINEVIKQLISRFKPQPSFIKQRIEDLIEKEYLRRDDADRSVYQYLA
ncbi:DEKNAAC101713 [Brettanomyces naardenensis]|uniref:DEKNAAC101713 n=1 Tax=Brettanomyces naardenensis TaxID=13370 RepID=A0A448YIR3_BRENA|nr:DEKNAAC101713 [Brettanomyces naardenensis]